jgi:hypothetical protein
LQGKIFVPPNNIITGISICCCIAADGEHLPTAIICDESYDLSPLHDHHSTDFWYVLNFSLKDF